MTAPDVELRRAWQQITGGGHDMVIDAVVARYAEPHRRYHTATHVMSVLRHVDVLLAAEPGSIDGDAVRAAALFHDIVYLPGSTTNETASAAIAARDLEGVGWSTDRIAAVCRLIKATATHLASAGDEAVLLDADLAILGAEPAAYDAYMRGVRDEYSNLSDGEWRHGRRGVLSALLGHSSIYATEAMRRAREHRARANMAAELAALG